MSTHRSRPAPPFQAIDQEGRLVRSDDLRGRWIVLYFYPKDETIGCTREACGFRDAFTDLRAEGAVVIGVSRDSTESHQRFAAHHRLPFQLLADPDGGLQKAFGARGLFGLPRRRTFLIDPEGDIVKDYRVRNWSEHASDVLADLKALKLGGKAEEPTKSEGL